MKVQTSLFGLILLTSASVYAQLNSPAGRRAEATKRDPFDAVQAYLEDPDSSWPHDDTPTGLNKDSHSATISVQQLQHKIPKDAAKEYRKGREAFKKGDNEAAKGHLQKAIEIDPEFANAYNDLGVVLGKFGDDTGSVEQFRKAVALAPGHKEATANLSIALFTLRRYHEACGAARQAIKIAPGVLYIRYVLAMCLLEERGDKTEVREILEGSAK